MKLNNISLFENGKVYENTVGVLTNYGLQPKGVKMKSKDWGKMLTSPMKQDQFDRTFKLV